MVYAGHRIDSTSPRRWEKGAAGQRFTLAAPREHAGAGNRRIPHFSGGFLEQAVLRGGARSGETSKHPHFLKRVTVL